jgi:hypothetical protein
MGRAFSTHERDDKLKKMLVGKPEGNRQLGRPKCKLVDDIKIDFKETG